MSKDLFNRYVWFLDTIKRRGRISRRELSERWQQSGISDGAPLCRRTLSNYRAAIEELFHVRIACDPATYEYYIADEDEHNRSVTDWLLNTKAVNEALTAASDIADRIFADDIPSAREHLGTVIEAIRQSRRISFDYHNYARSRPTRAVVYEPYFLKAFKQRWYVIGQNVTERKIKTYALDRMSAVTHRQETFQMPATFSPAEYLRDAFGIVVTQNQPKRIAIRTDHRQANYFRDLPLHHSQQESVHDGFSIFYYNMRITDDLVNELLSYGPRITVLEPPELRAALITSMRSALDLYKDTERTTFTSTTATPPTGHKSLK